MESKIEATRRLKSDGRWDEASAAKDREKTRLVESGMTRRQAGPLAWEWMIENFPPLSAADKAWRDSLPLIKIERFSSELLTSDDAEGYSINDYWWVLRYLLACDLCIQRNDVVATIEIRQRLLDEWTSKDQAVLATLAVADLPRFIDACEARVETSMFILIDAKDSSMLEIDALAHFYDTLRPMGARLEAFQAENSGDLAMSGKYRELFAA